MYFGRFAPPRNSASARATAPCAGSTFERPRLGTRRHLRQASAQVVGERRDHPEHAASQNERKGVAAHLEPGRDRRRGQRQLIRGALEDLHRHRVAAIPRALDDRAERRDVRPRHLPVVDDGHEASGVGDAEMRQHVLGQRRARAAAVDLANRGGQRLPADPVAAALVADHVAPAARSCSQAAGVASVGDRSGAGDDDDARRLARRRDQRDQGVVHDDDA